MKTPTPGGMLAARVVANNDWLAHCKNLYRKTQKVDGQFARVLREERRLSLRTVATAMGVSAAFLSDLERGNRNWTTSSIAKWAAVINPAPMP